MKSFLKRIVTAVILILLVYLLIRFLPPYYFSALVFLVVSVAVVEFVKLTQPHKYSYPLIFFNGILIGLSFTFQKPELALTVTIIVVTTGAFFLFSVREKKDLGTVVRDAGVHFLVFFYLYFPLYCLYLLKKMDAHYLLILVFIVVIGDSAAYFIGSAVGSRKVYPVASPNKTLEGIIAAVFLGTLSGWVAPLIFPVPTIAGPVWRLITGGLMGLLSQISDPVESLFKRAAAKKDSGSFLPGHGGLLDRLDSYIFCAPVFYYLVTHLWF